jgi:hypothetical protein
VQYDTHTFVFSESGGLGLLRGEKALLLLSDFKEPSRRFAVRLDRQGAVGRPCAFLAPNAGKLMLYGRRVPTF